MTPYEIGLLVHYCCTESEPPGDEPIRADTKAEFIRLGLLETCEPQSLFRRHVKATEKLQVYVEALTAVPLPVQKWVIPE